MTTLYKHSLANGEITSTIYESINNEEYTVAIKHLKNLQCEKSNSVILSLLGFCYYQSQQFISAGNCFEVLSKLNKNTENVSKYLIYYAQSLYKEGLYEEALNVVRQITNEGVEITVIKLTSAIHYAMNELSLAKSFIAKYPSNDIEAKTNSGCLFYRDGSYKLALKKFLEAMQITGFKPDLSYYIALCYYKLTNYTEAIKNVDNIIKYGIKQYPELCIGLSSNENEINYIRNSPLLQRSKLIEAFNLKMAIQFNYNNLSSADEALRDMPARAEHDLDAITLHNQSLLQMENNPQDGFKKLQFLIVQNSFPAEAFPNLLTLYIKYEQYELAADMIGENSHQLQKYLTPFLNEFLEAVISKQTSPEEAYKKLDYLSNKQIEKLRKIRENIQLSRDRNNECQINCNIVEYKSTMENFIPILMQQAKIYWDVGNYKQVELVFHKASDFCSENETWIINIAHELFMQEKYSEAINFYETIVTRHYANILEVSAVVLANLCVSYVMEHATESAEDLMRKIEKEEQQFVYNNSEKHLYHYCIVNLVLGTLYCSKGNYDFGISRVIKSMSPFKTKLSTETWFYAKRCFLSLIESLSNNILLIHENTYKECIHFLVQCEVYGQTISANIEQPIPVNMLYPGKNTIIYEARILRYILMNNV